MADKLYSEEAVQAIAAAIRTQNGTTATYTIAEMAQAILDLPVTPPTPPSPPTSLIDPTILYHGNSFVPDDLNYYKEVTLDNRNCIELRDDFYNWNSNIDMSWFDPTKTYKIEFDAKYVNNGDQKGGQFDFMILTANPHSPDLDYTSGPVIPITALRNENAYNAISQDWFHREVLFGPNSGGSSWPSATILPTAIEFGYNSDNGNITLNNRWYIDIDSFSVTEVTE